MLEELDQDESIDEEAELYATLNLVRHGALSTPFASALEAAPGVEPRLRNLFAAIVRDKGFFVLNGDGKSLLVYDVIFDVYSRSTDVPTPEDFLEAYEDLIAFGDGEVNTGGYAPGVVQAWLQSRLESRAVVVREGSLVLSEEERARVAEALDAYR